MTNGGARRAPSRGPCLIEPPMNQLHHGEQVEGVLFSTGHSLTVVLKALADWAAEHRDTEMASRSRWDTPCRVVPDLGTRETGVIVALRPPLCLNKWEAQHLAYQRHQTCQSRHESYRPLGTIESYP